MDQLFGIPTHHLALAAALLLGAVLAAMVGVAWRRPVLVRLGLRAVPRRRLRTALIVLGLTASTAVITTAIGTGETMAGTIRAVVAGGIGPVDELVVAGTRPPNAPGLRDPRAVLAGADLAAGTFFPEGTYEHLAGTVAHDPDVAAFEPAVQAQATAVSPSTGRAHTGVNLLGLRPEGAYATFTTTEGSHISLADLAEGEVLVNDEATRLLGVGPGEALEFDLAEKHTATWKVRAVVRDGGLAGVQAAALAPLGAVQATLERPGQVNQILVGNRPGGDRTARSRAVTGRLRMAMADQALLAQVARALASDTGQSQIRALEGRVRPEARSAIERMRAAARAGKATPELAYYLADPLLTTQYRWVLNAVAGSSGTRGNDLANRIAPATVLEVKERAIAAANEYGSAVTTVFLILGLFSIAASLLLVFLIFVMLAAERRQEMGMLRAVGMQRHHLVTVFAVEGLAYDLAASAVGLGLGIGVGAMVLNLMQNVLDRFDVQVRGQISTGGIVLSFCLGALVTFATVLLAAWKVSHVNIVAAVHGAPDSPPRRATGEQQRAAARALGLVLIALAGATLLVTAHGAGTQLATGASLLVLSLAFGARSVALAILAHPRFDSAFRAPRSALVGRIVACVAGPSVALFFALAPDPPPSVRNDAVIRSGTAGFVLAGVAMALALVWVAGQNLDVILWPVRALARPFGSLAPATKMAVAYPLTHPFRTALTAAMFALVFLTMVAATTLLRSTEVAYVKRDGGAGFDIRATFAKPPEAMEQTLGQSASVRMDDFTVIGGQAMSPVEALWPGEAKAVWRPVEVRVADAALLGGSSGQLLARAAGFESDELVWRAVRDDPGAALISRNDLSGLPAVQAAVEKRSGGIVRFDPVAVWVRDPRGGPARKLTVIGVTADGAILPSGLLVSQPSMSGVPAASQPPAEYFFRTREDVSYRSAATGIQLSFPEGDVRTRILGDEARTGHAVRGLLDTLVRGFLGMGLVAGLAALGVIGMRSVAERRQQIGMLRAIGFTRRAVQLTFLLEGSVVAMLGITVGGVVGLILAKNVVAYLSHDFSQLELIVPWTHVLAIAGAAYAAALASALLVAWQSGRITPADALRYE